MARSIAYLLQKGTAENDYRDALTSIRCFYKAHDNLIEWVSLRFNFSIYTRFQLIEFTV